MIWQWLIVALIGLAALWMVARHFGVGQKKAGCPGCNSCEKPRDTARPPTRAPLQ